MVMIFWAFLGAVAGWIASILSGHNSLKASLPSILVGIIGALLGGLYVRAFAFSGGGLGLASVITAIIGAVVVLTSYKAIDGK